MKFIIMVILGLVLFNGFILLFAPYFPGGSAHLDATDADAVAVGNIEGVLKNLLTDMNTWALFGILTFAGGVAGVLTGANRPLIIGASLTFAMIGTLYIQTSKVFLNLTTTGGGNVLLHGLIIIVTGILGVLLIFEFGSYMAGRSDLD